MSAFTGEPRRSDLRMILRALKNGWPVEPQRLLEAEALAIRASVTGKNDRLVNLGREVMQAISDHRLKAALTADHELLESMMEVERQRDANPLNRGDYPRLLPTIESGPDAETA